MQIKRESRRKPIIIKRFKKSGTKLITRNIRMLMKIAETEGHKKQCNKYIDVIIMLIEFIVVCG